MGDTTLGVATGESQPTVQSSMLTISGLLVCNFLIAVDTTCLSVALPTIAINLAASDTQTYWAGTAFVLCSAVFQPIFSSLSDALGRKPMFLLSLTLFTIGSVVCAVAHDIATLISGRCVQGTGAGGLVVLTYVMSADLFDLKHRAQCMSLIGLTWLTGAVCGPIMSGGFTDSSLTWRWLFYFNLPFCGIGLIVSALFLKVPYHITGSRIQKLKAFDWLGCALFAASLTSLLIGLSWGGIMYAWHSWMTVFPVTSGATGLILFGLYSELVSERPMIPLQIMNNRTAAISYFCLFVHGFCQFGLTFYLPIYYEAVRGYTSLLSGVASLPGCAMSGVFTVTTASLIAKTGKIRVFCLLGWTVLLLGVGMQQFLDLDSVVHTWLSINMIAGMGLGILFSAVPLATQAAAEQTGSAEDVAKIKSMAASLNPFFRAIGQCIGIVIGQAALSNGMEARLGETIAKQAVGLALKVRTLSITDQIIYKEAYVDSLRTNWWIMFGLVCSAGLLTTLTVNQRIDIAQQSDNGSLNSQEEQKNAQEPRDPEKSEASSAISIKRESDDDSDL